MAILNTGDKFPSLTVTLAGGGTLTVPSEFHGDFSVVLFNRGSWCPFCTGQLRAFQRALPELEAASIKIVSTSVDDEATTQEVIKKNKLTFPVAYGADADALAAATGAFVNPDPKYLEATGFVLDPEGKIVVAVYSTGAIGRLVPEDVLGVVRYSKEH